MKRIILNLSDEFCERLEAAAAEKMLNKTAFIRSEIAKIIREDEKRIKEVR